MAPCTTQSSVGRAMPMAMVDTTYDSLALPSQVLVGQCQWQWWIQLMTPCTTQSSVGRAMSMAMVDTTYDSLHCPVKCW